MASCYATWHKAYPKPYKGATNDYIEEQGPIAAWCSVIRLFADAATKAGKDLNRRTFVEGMASIKNFRGHPHTHVELRSTKDVRSRRRTRW